MTRFSSLVFLLVAALASGLASQQRDVPPGAQGPTGTSEIRGIVMSDEPAPRPIRRAVVTVSGDVPSARSVITDDEGRFSFAGLPEGRFTIAARKAAFLPAAYGASRPGRPGTSIQLAAGQHLTVSVTMARGGVITGTLRDQSGLPLAGVSVGATDARALSGLAGADSSPNPPWETTTTDDRGVFRLFGLMPGEYIVAATPTPSGGDTGMPSTSDMDALLKSLAQRQGTGVAMVATSAEQPKPAPIATPPPVGYAPVYFPGSPIYTEATRVRLAAGEERTGVDFQVTPIPVASISGTVSGDVANLAGVQLSIIIGGPRTAGLGTSGITGQPPDAEGKFKFGNISPGSYRLVARARRGQGPPPSEAARVIISGAGSGGGRGVPPSDFPGTPASGDMLFAVVDLEVRGQDIANVGLTLQPGGTLSGRLVFDAGTAPVPSELTRIRMSLGQPGGSYMSSSGGVVVGNSIVSVAPAAVRPDGTFEITGIGPGRYSVSCLLPPELSATWRMRSAVLDGRDLLDTLVDGALGMATTGVTVTLSDKRTELSGTLQTAAGLPAPDYFVLVFPADRSFWRAGSRRVQSVRPASDGKFVVRDLPAGEYLIAALTDVEPNEWQDPAFLDQIAAAGVKVVLSEGEKKTQDLRIAR